MVIESNPSFNIWVVFSSPSVNGLSSIQTAWLWFILGLIVDHSHAWVHWELCRKLRTWKNFPYMACWSSQHVVILAWHWWMRWLTWQTGLSSVIWLTEYWVDNTCNGWWLWLVYRPDHPPLPGAWCHRTGSFAIADICCQRPACKFCCTAFLIISEFHLI